MNAQMYSRPTPIVTMADGTIKQVNPFSGTQVWTVPGRANRPLTHLPADIHKLTYQDHVSTCAFCSDRQIENASGKARMVQSSVKKNSDWEILRGVGAEDLYATTAAFRRVPNLFEIVSYDYWHDNYDYSLDSETQARMERYIASDLGRKHVLEIIKTKRKAAGNAVSTDYPENELLKDASAFFGGGHDVIIARRHYTDDATHSDQPASAGTLTYEEHEAFIRFTIDSLRDLYSRNRYAPYVAVFQNWLKPAGASFDHLHKQLVAVDERGVHSEMEVQKLRQNPNMYNEWAVDFAAMHNLVIAENDHAICFAGFGHRFPTLEVFSKSAVSEPWLQSSEEIRDMSDLVHACHAGAGPQVPCNEEWHHKPVDVDIPMPWRIMIKWRVSTLAGFEGGTKIYLNTLSPWDVRDRIVHELYSLRDQGRISPNIRIATECAVQRNSLKYNVALH
ncbi:Galactose-1-phosphate uridylyltransferase [Corynebacterium pseudotuberculosis]|uniref:DUF4921 family protein n=1 Tax=Corynebacterium pseudotuberculosis TaxID=1719 RepID=UPI0007192C43|nr:DUF4921 family protein [Corynebacterium pseudotuberculosis]ALP34013.1 Galactose-1-phosphate uridylyltransferase [Corynebacterium pseudotuberculosis]ALR33955.1 Hypothetical protein CpPA01_1294 [Corynebacterium pseudotuberculosis]